MRVWMLVTCATLVAGCDGMLGMEEGRLADDTASTSDTSEETGATDARGDTSLVEDSTAEETSPTDSAAADTRDSTVGDSRLLDATSADAIDGGVIECVFDQTNFDECVFAP